MKYSISIKLIAVALAFVVLFSSCSSTTMIHSLPSGAKVYIDNEPVGQTPYSYTDSKIVGSSTSVRLEKEGYETLRTHLTKDEEINVGAIIGGLFVWVPFLWAMKYKDSHTYELSSANQNNSSTTKHIQKTSKADRLRELKKMLDEKLITEKEYQEQKDKILSESN